MKKAKCRRCMNLNYDFLLGTYEDTDDYFCGLHGRAPVDPDGEQMNLDRRGGCGFHPRNEPIQLDLFREWKITK